MEALFQDMVGNGGLMIFILPPGGGEYLIEQDAVESRMRRH